MLKGEGWVELGFQVFSSEEGIWDSNARAQVCRKLGVLVNLQRSEIVHTMNFMEEKRKAPQNADRRNTKKSTEER